MLQTPDHEIPNTHGSKTGGGIDVCCKTFWYPRRCQHAPKFPTLGHQHSLEQPYANIVIHSNFCGIKKIFQGQWGPARQKVINGSDNVKGTCVRSGTYPLASGCRRRSWENPAPYTKPNAKKNDVQLYHFFINPFQRFLSTKNCIIHFFLLLVHERALYIFTKTYSQHGQANTKILTQRQHRNSPQL